MSCLFIALSQQSFTMFIVKQYLFRIPRYINNVFDVYLSLHEGILLHIEKWRETGVTKNLF